MSNMIGNYSLDRKLSHSENSEVFEGSNDYTGQKVVIKKMSRTGLYIYPYKQVPFDYQFGLITSFMRCPHILTQLDRVQAGPHYYLITQLCNQGTLQDYLATNPVGEEEALRLTRQIIIGCQTLRDSGLIHLDLKPQTILMHDGTIKLTGIKQCQFLQNDEDLVKVQPMGDPYKAPEVISSGLFSWTSKIWQIAAILHQMLFNQLPEKEIDPMLQDKVSKQTWDLLTMMLARKPEERIHWEELLAHPTLNLKWTYEKSLSDSDGVMPKQPFNHPEWKTTSFDDRLKCQQPSNNMAKSQSVSQNESMTESCSLSKALVILPSGKVFPPYQQKLFTMDKSQQVPENIMYSSYSYNASLLHESDLDTDNMPNSQNHTSLESSHEQSLQRTQCQSLCQSLYQSQPQSQNVFQRNSNYLMHLRNIYAFIGAVGRDAVKMNLGENGQLVGYLMHRNMLQLFAQLLLKVKDGHSFPQFNNWAAYVKHRSFSDLKRYLHEQFSSFKQHFEFYHNYITTLRYHHSKEVEKLRDSSIKMDSSLYRNQIKAYWTSLRKELEQRYFEEEAEERKYLTHVANVLDCYDMENAFQFERDHNGDIKEFDFQQYHQTYTQIPLDQFREDIIKKTYTNMHR